MSLRDEYAAAQERGYVTAEEVERWTGTDRSTRWRRWWYAPDGITRWDDLRDRAEMRLVRYLGRERECGCTVLTRRRLRFWCADCIRDYLME